jgi:hypothetical protein
MKKENVVVYADNPQTRHRIMSAFKECISFATSREYFCRRAPKPDLLIIDNLVAQPNRPPPPPMPSLNGIPPPEHVTSPHNSAPSPHPSDRAMSPPSSAKSMSPAPGSIQSLAPRRFSPPGPPRGADAGLPPTPGPSGDMQRNMSVGSVGPNDFQSPNIGPMSPGGMTGQPQLPPKGPPQQFPGPGQGPPRGPGFPPGPMPPHMQGSQGPPGAPGPHGPPGSGGMPPHMNSHGPGGQPPPHMQQQFPPGPGGFPPNGQMQGMNRPLPPYAVPQRPDSAGSGRGPPPMGPPGGFGGPAIRKAASSGALASQYEQAALNGPECCSPPRSTHVLFP